MKVSLIGFVLALFLGWMIKYSFDQIGVGLDITAIVVTFLLGFGLGALTVTWLAK